MANLDNLWQAYTKNKSPAAKEKLILHYAPLVKYTAGRLLIHIGHHVEMDDLVGYGIFGLIDAVEKFDFNHEKGAKFETYASFRIRGAIMDYIRKMDWVPRTYRERNKLLEQAYSQLEDELERSPTDEELAEKLGMTLEETRDLMRKSPILSLVSYDDFIDQSHEQSFSSLTTKREDLPEQQVEKQELKELLADAINKLDERERLIITLYYFEGLTIREISSIMKISESRVSQINSRAIRRLQSKLGRYRDLLFV